MTARFVEAARPARVLDTRKTTPGWRTLEKQAVAAGGGVNHRMGLHDMVLVKDNHLALGGVDLPAAVARALPSVTVCRGYKLSASNIPLAKYGGRHTVTMLPGALAVAADHLGCARRSPQG